MMEICENEVLSGNLFNNKLSDLQKVREQSLLKMTRLSEFSTIK